MCVNENDKKTYAMKIINKSKLKKLLMHSKIKSDNIL
jgi:hypothetical protein